MANVGPGFDVLAFALEGPRDRVVVEALEGRGEIFVRGYGVPTGSENLAYHVARRALLEAGRPSIDLVIEVYKGVPIGEGLGSSGASSAATAYALGVLLGLDDHTILMLAGYGESVVAGQPHYDNVSASLLGGFVIVDPSGPQAYRIASRLRLCAAIVSPGRLYHGRKTGMARSLLPESYNRGAVVRQLACVSMLIHSLYTGNLELLAKSVSCDQLAEPYRARMIPGYGRLKERALREGARGFNIAGAGPSMFLLHEDCSEAERIAGVLADMLASEGFRPRVILSRIPAKGARLVEHG